MRIRILVVGCCLVLAVALPIPTAGAVESGYPDDFVFSAPIDESGRAYDLYTIAPDGTGRRRLTWNAYARYVSGPEAGWESASNWSSSWSPDGQRIAFTNFENWLGINSRGDLRTMNPDGTGVAVLFDPNVPLWVSTTDWSPDGTRLAFVDPYFADLAVINTDGTGVRQLPTGDENYYTSQGAAWSPDGERIGFSTQISDSQFALRTIRPDGTGLETVATAPWIGQIDWSPDGSMIAFEWGPTTAWEHGARPEGVRWGPATGGPWNEVSGPSGRDVWNPMWSPGGAELAFLVGDSSAIDPSREIWELDLASRSTHRILTLPDLSIDVDWRSLPVTHPVGLVDPDRGRWHLARADHGVDSFYYGNPGDVPFVGDWDCDGVDTPGLYRQSDGFAYLRNANSQGVADIRFFFGNPSDVPIAGDFDGDGCDTLSLYRPDSQEFFIINELGRDGGGLGAADYSFVFGNPGDQPFSGDLDGDGIDEVGLHRASTGFVYYRTTLTTGVADRAFFFGDPADRFVTGDWNRNGTDSPAVFRPSNTFFYFRYSNTQGNADAWFEWGDPTWLPVAGTFGQ